MNITVVFRHMAASDAVKRHIEEKLEKIKKYLIHPIEAHVVVSVEKFRQQCEVVVKARDFHAQALEVNDDLFTSIDKSIHKIERQVSKHKEIVKEHKGHLATGEAALLVEQEAAKADF